MRTILVTGATGLIGAALVRRFAVSGDRVYAAVRNVAKGEMLFAGTDNVTVVEWDVLRRKICRLRIA